MAKKKISEGVTIHEALDNLSLISEIDPNDPYRIGINKNNKFIIQDDASASIAEWLTSDSASVLYDNISETYQVVMDYLKSVYRDPETDWNLPKTRKGMQAMMLIVGESAHKFDLLLQNMDSHVRPESITKSKTYQHLIDFYAHHIESRFDQPIEGEEEWVKDWEETEKELQDYDTKGLKDFETIRRDTEYELFYLKDDNDRPFFHPKLLRNIKLICDFDESVDIPLEEDPLMNIVIMRDKDLAGAADQILHGADKIIAKFYEQKLRRKQNSWIHALYNAILALNLCANQKNLIGSTAQKNSLRYFLDFQKFLKEALVSPEYQNLIAYPPEKSNKEAHLLLKLTHELCKNFFLRKPSIKQEMCGYIHRLIRKGEEHKKEAKEKLYHSQSMFNRLMEEDDAIRTLLDFFPNGPLFKILDTIRENVTYFEPLHMENYPYHLFEMKVGKKTADVIKLPSPTHQEYIAKANISDEFRGMIKAYEKKKHLLINLQDRTSWKESARARILENLSKQAEYSKSLDVITINKDTDFYHQTDIYLTMHEASDFLHALKQQFSDPLEHGFFFTPKLEQSKIDAMVDKLIKEVHTVYFSKKKTLSRKEKLDFIELFYLLLTELLIEELEPDSVSFTCKDGVDAGALMTAGLYVLTHRAKLTEKQKEMLHFLLYAPSLLVRERAPDSSRFNRLISALSNFENHLK